MGQLYSTPHYGEISVMSKKIIVVAASEAETVRDALNEHEAWDDFDLVIVPDEEFDQVRKAVPEMFPGKMLRDVKMEDFVK